MVLCHYKVTLVDILEEQGEQVLEKDREIQVKEKVVDLQKIIKIQIITK